MANPADSPALVASNVEVADSNAQDAPADSSPILSLRPGYGEPLVSHEPLVVCADDLERQYLLEFYPRVPFARQQRRYRHMPDIVISKLREANGQLQIMTNSYGNFTESQQSRFAEEARQEIESIQSTLAVLQGTPRPKESTTQKKIVDARNGAILQMVEAASLGMPLEVWKTHLGRYRNQGTIEGLMAIYRSNGGGFAGARAFWRGTSAKMVESASKGSVLMFSKEFIKDSALGMGVSPTAAGFLAGAGGGVCQVSVMGPCTFLVTSAVTNKQISLTEQIRATWQAKGFRGFYPGGTAIAFRQATNWASRQGFTDAVREIIKKVNYDNPATARLTVFQEVCAGVIGGTLACWNHPFEVARIEAQARAAANEPSLSMLATMRHVVDGHGFGGLFKGVVPRIFLGIWQTTFMVTGANLIRTHILNAPSKSGH
ncbi:uncharacterized protein MONBRDRAFT_26061 [Monosiga brevicollis MX1]|uniref:Mitochondrial carrier protein n=1 Tax=Monosiga brevicollis TaxID=81824 RepID=A9V192_MONBE|nr:uncharacterized protein MONBRDRAFT_26061 [Monosiga brevicollis MX1]EDQ88891.1 predicted protein [Monosiga brevicollis MX1]|eukprot:XP_001746504.1 hypothetical protein [Monosiga brevicollis MX1]